MPLLALAITLLCTQITAQAGPHFASGIKIGEATENSAIIWVRLTTQAQADFDLLPILSDRTADTPDAGTPMPDNVVPGMKGQVRLIYRPVDPAAESGTSASESNENKWANLATAASGNTSTDWVDVDESTDFSLQFHLESLRPGATSLQAAQSRAAHARAEGAAGERDSGAQITGRFQTAPPAERAAPVRFVVTTCQAVRSIDSGADGHVAYAQMAQFEPNFLVHTGDILYYDRIPLCRTKAQARAKWNLMFAYGHNREFHRFHSSYFMKDDHDTLKNDCWPGQRYGELTFEQGLEIFREQVPMGEQTYRTARWGRDLQVWMTENRDFRSSNRDPDGPDKSILGAEQKRWLMTTIEESNATFKFVISPGPLVGPDKAGKADNHSNAAFAHEGNELRKFLSEQANTFVICGDRHWQYCSQDPATGLIELGCGAINDQHNFGGKPAKNAEMHRYFGPHGGFLGITVDKGVATAQWFHSNEIDADTGMPEVLHREVFTRR